ncbi:MAG: hypothetical protein NT052_01660 [Candidatus Shapirobacteria bacterium]|nr:hypothetical protein [Candidatus Shapirobacteria bacterium]
MEKNINLNDTQNSSELKALEKPWLDKIIFDFKKKLIMIEKTPDKDGDVELLCLEPDPLNENQCSLSGGYKNKRTQYISEGIIKTVDAPFGSILMFLQPLIASIEVKD